MPTNALAPTGGNLWNLNGQLFEMLEEREAIGARCAVPGPEADSALEELRAIDSAIGEFISTKVSEVTELRACVFALRDGVEINQKRAADAAARAGVLQRRLDGITDLIKGCMETLGKKRFESPEGFFRLQGNGGVQPVVVTNEALLPDEMCNVTVTINLAQWRSVERACFPALGEVKVGKITPNLSAIGKALAKDAVAGARLEERGKSVVIR